MAALTFTLLQFVTCSNSIFPQLSHAPQQPGDITRDRLPTHRRGTSSRSMSDSATLRPSNDRCFAPLKSPAPSLRYTRTFHMPQQSLPRIPNPTPLVTESDHPAFKLALQAPHDNLSQANLLPSPLAPIPLVTLPLRPDRTTSMRSHPPSSGSFGAPTVTSSVYSRSVSTESLFARQSSPLSSVSDESGSKRKPELPVSEQSIVPRPPTPHQVEEIFQCDCKPVRPESKPPMPQAAFWMYARQVQQQHNAMQETESVQTHALVSPSKSRDPFRESVLVHNVPFDVLDSDMDDDAQTVEEHKAGFYERLRKGTRSPLWSGKRDLERKIAAAVSEDSKVRGEDLGRTKSKAGKVAKKRKPSTAF